MGLINGVESNLPMYGDGEAIAQVGTGEEKYVGVPGSSATLKELDRVGDASARIVTTTATALSLTATQHAERVLLINSNSTVANTFLERMLSVVYVVIPIQPPPRFPPILPPQPLIKSPSMPRLPAALAGMLSNFGTLLPVLGRFRPALPLTALKQPRSPQPNRSTAI